MKKKTRFLLSSILSALILTGCSTSSGNLSGTMLDEAEEGTGEYDWKKYDVHISLGTENLATEYRTNHAQDCIYDISYKMNVVYAAKPMINHTKNTPLVRKHEYVINYRQKFNWTDDLEAFFVFSNGYVTEMETSHTQADLDYIKISEEDVQGTNFDNAYIKEIWVRTDD